MSKLKAARAEKHAEKIKKQQERGKVTSINEYKRQVPAFEMVNGEKYITHEEIAGRCMTTADMIARQTKGAFLKLYAEPEAIPMCYMLFAYHQNCMIVNDMNEADVIVECYEQDEAPHIMGTKDSVVYLALFKPDEGVMPWLVVK